MEVILAARRTCPVCKREIFIDNGKGVKMPEESGKKTPNLKTEEVINLSVANTSEYTMMPFHAPRPESEGDPFTEVRGV